MTTLKSVIFGQSWGRFGFCCCKHTWKACSCGFLARACKQAVLCCDVNTWDSNSRQHLLSRMHSHASGDRCLLHVCKAAGVTLWPAGASCRFRHHQLPPPSCCSGCAKPSRPLPSQLRLGFPKSSSALYQVSAWVVDRPGNAAVVSGHAITLLFAFAGTTDAENRKTVDSLRAGNVLQS